MHGTAVHYAETQRMHHMTTHDCNVTRTHHDIHKHYYYGSYHAASQYRSRHQSPHNSTHYDFHIMHAYDTYQLITKHAEKIYLGANQKIHNRNYKCFLWQSPVMITTWLAQIHLTLDIIKLTETNVSLQMNNLTANMTISARLVNITQQLSLLQST